MSIGFGRSYQHVGLNRVGAYHEISRDKGPRADRRAGDTIAKAEKPNEIWRRITGIYPDAVQKPKDRKRGLKLLARRIQDRVRRATSSAEMQRDGEQLGGQQGVAGLGAPAPGLAAGTGPLVSAGDARHMSLTADWALAAEDWVRVQRSGVSVEALCVELGCTRARLTALLKEYCGLSAPEFLDGLKLSRLRKAWVLRLREAASELWGFPGSYVAVKLGTDEFSQRRDGAKKGRTERGEGNARRGEKRSRYFHTGPEELFLESRADERARRVAELCAMLRVDFELESWAVGAGYESGAKLKRACLNVFGRTLAQTERQLAGEVVQFYFCAEDRALREIARRDDGSVIVGRARELYHGSEDIPEAPFVDEYAKFEELKAEWLSRMWDNFNCEYLR